MDTVKWHAVGTDEPTFSSKFLELDLPKRQQLSDRALKKHVNRIPVIVDRISKESMDISKHKFLVPHELSLGEFVGRLRLLSDASRSYIFFVKTKQRHILPPLTDQLQDLYEQHKEDDGFLYLTFQTESVFGIQGRC
jgi:GABA(A) receptor-associated protein